MKQRVIILTVNISIFILYYIQIRLSTMDNTHRNLSLLVSLAFAIGFHLIINTLIAIVCFIFKENILAKSFILATGVILPLGFICLWNTGLLF